MKLVSKIQHNSILSISQLLSNKYLITDKRIFFDIIKSLKPGVVKSLDYILGLDNQYEVINPSQTKIAAFSDRVRETGNRHVKKLKEVNLVRTFGRFKKTSFYYLHPLFYNIEIRRTLQHIFKAFRWLPKNKKSLNRLFGSIDSVLVKSENVTLYKERDFKELNINNISDINVESSKMNNEKVNELVKKYNLEELKEKIEHRRKVVKLVRETYDGNPDTVNKNFYIKERDRLNELIFAYNISAKNSRIINKSDEDDINTQQKENHLSNVKNNTTLQNMFSF